MEKRASCQVKAECLHCGWVKEGVIEATSEEALASEAHRFFNEQCSSHSCGKDTQWRLQWGPVRLL